MNNKDNIVDTVFITAAVAAGIGIGVYIKNKEIKRLKQLLRVAGETVSIFGRIIQENQDIDDFHISDQNVIDFAALHIMKDNKML